MANDSTHDVRSGCIESPPLAEVDRAVAPISFAAACTDRRILHRAKPGAAAAASLAIGLLGIAGSARAQWTARSLHPADASGPSFAFGTWGAQQVGHAILFNGGVPHAGLWNGTAASWVDLHPSGATRSDAVGVFGSQQVGSAEFAGANHAGLWNSTAASWVDLHPAGASVSVASGTNGTHQVGSVDGQASLWNGTAASLVSLEVAGAISSHAFATNGTQQVGHASFEPPTGHFVPYHAGYWSGTAASWVDLHPTGAITSSAIGISGTQQVGSAIFSDGFRAGIWSGTAASWVDLNPAGAVHSLAYGGNGTWQVGVADFGDGYDSACIWNGTAASWEDLSLALIGSWGDALATSVWSDGLTLSVTGWGYNLVTERNEALLWTRPIPAPGAAIVWGFAGLFAARRPPRKAEVLGGSGGEDPEDR